MALLTERREKLQKEHCAHWENRQDPEPSFFCLERGDGRTPTGRLWVSQGCGGRSQRARAFSLKGLSVDSHTSCPCTSHRTLAQGRSLGSPSPEPHLQVRKLRPGQGVTSAELGGCLGRLPWQVCCCLRPPLRLLVPYPAPAFLPCCTVSVDPFPREQG